MRLKCGEADAVGWTGHRYDALLDEYEPGCTAAELTPLFAGLTREHLAATPSRLRFPSNPTVIIGKSGTDADRMTTPGSDEHYSANVHVSTRNRDP